jgi:hypothetical protein
MITGSCWGLLAKPPSSTSGPNSQDRRHPAGGPGASRFRRPGRLEAWPDGGKEGGGRGELGDVLTLERENGRGAGGGSTRRRRPDAPPATGSGGTSLSRRGMLLVASICSTGAPMPANQGRPAASLAMAGSSAALQVRRWLGLRVAGERGGTRMARAPFIGRGAGARRGTHAKARGLAAALRRLGCSARWAWPGRADWPLGRGGAGTGGSSPRARPVRNRIGFFSFFSEIFSNAYVIPEKVQKIR